LPVWQGVLRVEGLTEHLAKEIDNRGEGSACLHCCQEAVAPARSIAALIAGNATVRIFDL